MSSAAANRPAGAMNAVSIQPFQKQSTPKLIFECSNGPLDLETSLLPRAGTIAMTERRKAQRLAKLLETAVHGSLQVESGVVTQSGVDLPIPSETPRVLEVFILAKFTFLHSLMMIEQQIMKISPMPPVVLVP